MNNRRRITGVVTSNKMEKTAVVEISRTYRHELYKKVIHSYKRVMAHDELGCEVGDHVIIVESRPISKRKQWVVQEILRHDIAAAEAELLQQRAEAETVEVEAKMESEVEVEEVEEVEDVETAEEVEPEPEAELEAQESGEEPEMDEEPGMVEESEASEDDEAESEVSPEETDAEDKE